MNTKPDRYTNVSARAGNLLIRDGDIPGHNITILEESTKMGGSRRCRNA